MLQTRFLSFTLKGFPSFKYIQSRKGTARGPGIKIKIKHKVLPLYVFNGVFCTYR